MGFYIQDDYWEALSDQPQKVRNEVLGALCELYFTGEAPTLSGLSRSFFVAFRERVTKARQKAEQKRNERGTNAATDAATDEEQSEGQIAQPASQESESERESKRKKSFTPPTREEAQAYLDSLGLSADLDKVFDFYESKGWMVGKNKMKDWRAAFRRAAREWARKEDADGEYSQAFGA